MERAPLERAITKLYKLELIFVKGSLTGGGSWDEVGQKPSFGDTSREQKTEPAKELSLKTNLS